MKRNNFIKLVILILSVFAIPTAHAAFDGQYIDANITVGDYPGVVHDVAWDCHENGCKMDYKLHKYTLLLGNQKYPAYCIFPNAHAHGKNKVTCVKVNRKTWPEAYYIADKYYDELMNNPIVADLVYRTYGSVYKFNGAIEGLDLDDMSQNQKVGEAQFTTTYQARVQGIKFGVGYEGFYGYTFHNKGTYVDNQTDEPGSVHDAMQIIKEAEEAVRAGYAGPEDDSTEITGGAGKKFNMTPVSDTLNADGSKTYIISSVNGVYIEHVDLKVTKGTEVNRTDWNGTSMTITVIPDPNDCKVAFTVCPTETPEPVKTGTPCNCWAPYAKKWERDYKWVNCRWPIDGKGQICDKEYTSDYYWHIKKKCYTDEKQCRKQQENYARLGDKILQVLDNQTKYSNDTLSMNYETEHDLTFDNTPAYELEDLDDSTATLAAEGEKQETTILYCQIGGDSTQSYLALVSGGNECESFTDTVPCNNCYSDCEPVADAHTFTDVYIKNCCEEEGGKAYGRQYALTELFCDYNENGIKVATYKEKCGAEEYEDKDNLQSNVYCKQYCSDSFHYTVPGPTHSKANAYFYFRTRIDSNISGPILNQWKRCRTLIDYDKWYKDYTYNADSIPVNYNAYQLAMANYTMWVDLGNAKNSYADSNNIGATTITCHKVFSKTCDDDPTCPADKPNCSDSEKTVQGTHDCSSSGSDHSASIGAPTLHYYPANTYYSSDKYLYPIIGRRGDEISGAYTYSKMFITGKGSPDDRIKYYDKTDVNNYVTAFNSTRSSAYNAANSDSVPSGYSNGGVSCSHGEIGAGNVASNIADPSEKQTAYNTAATNARGAVNGILNTINTLEANLNECGGKIISKDANGNLVKDDKSIEDRVKFEKEPEMEFSYVTAFIDDYGLEKDQELTIPFIKVGGTDGNGCAVDKATSFNDEQPEVVDNWMSGIQIFNDNYDKLKYSGSLQATIVDFEALNSNEFDNAKNYTVGNQYRTHERTYIADKKFTTDAAAHMVCKWKENGAEPEYTIYPHGLITEENTDSFCDIYPCVVHNLDGSTIESRGIYHTERTHVSGMYETYFTLKDISDGLFDDIVHEKGETCSGYKGNNYNGTPVNASCYMEINSYYVRLEDCTQLYDNVIGIGRVSGNGKAATELCCTDGNCLNKGEMLYEYKVVDPENMFIDTTRGDNYAYNWKKTSQGIAEETEMINTAKEDKTYSRENLTYSYTFTPRDLRAIREYNKTRISQGGYADWNMYCEDSTFNGRPVKIRCKSRFLDAISGVNSLNSGTVTLNLSTSNVDLNTVRNNRITNDKWGNE